MKKINLFLILLCISFGTLAQRTQAPVKPELPIDEETQKITYKEVVQVVGTPQELYDRAVAWATKEYKNTSEIFKLEDRENGILEMRSSVRIYSKAKDGTPFFKNIVYYRFKIECRDGRYRYTINEFNERLTAAFPIEIWFNTDDPKWQPSHFDYLTQVDEQIKTLISSLTKGMLPKEEKVDEW